MKYSATANHSTAKSSPVSGAGAACHLFLKSVLVLVPVALGALETVLHLK